MAVVIASDLAKDMVGEPLLRGVSFRLERRERLTLSGRNGSGKTTLLRMLAGETSVDGGELVFAKGTRIALHDQRPPRERELSLRDYVLSGAKELLAIEQRLAELEAAMAEGAHRRGHAQRLLDARRRGSSTRAATAGATGSTRRCTGSASATRTSTARSRRSPAASSRARRSPARSRATPTCCCSTSRPTTSTSPRSSGSRATCRRSTPRSCSSPTTAGSSRRWAPRCSSSRPAARSFFKGTWHAWRKEKAARELALGRAIERQQAEIERLERFVTRFRAGTRARQAQSRAKRLDKMERVTRDPRDGKGLGFAFKPPERSGRVVFEMEDATLRIGERELLRDAELWLERGEHVSLIGPNGSGKTTLITALAGERELDAGKLRTGHNVKLGVLSQHAEELDATATVLEAAQRATRPDAEQGARAARPVPVLRRGGREAGRRACRAASGGGCRWRSSSTPARTS